MLDESLNEGNTSSHLLFYSFQQLYLQLAKSVYSYSRAWSQNSDLTDTRKIMQSSKLIAKQLTLRLKCLSLYNVLSSLGRFSQQLRKLLRYMGKNASITWSRCCEKHYSESVLDIYM